MYKVFVNDKALFLTNEVQKETNFKIFLLESIDIKKLIIKLFQNKIENAFLYHPDEKLIMKTLKAKIPVVKAGGGLVYNEEGNVLFIYRNGKWDLPKGGTEKNETMEETAMREVEEETGVSGLSVVKKLQKTYHVFKRNGRYKLKQTYWYEMKSTFKGIPKGQEDEGIEKVEWIHPNDIPKLLENSYENIKLLFKK
ncbi:NUDIX hydrolase [Flavobacterium sp. HNIBRBA15423]|uniref:NUDIX hydrolase n=1 Tax=Flavobacterium sp. HNIBRBA15423 TaxID=3458683 RepID=UPI0040446D8F